MYAIVRKNTFDPAKFADGQHQLGGFNKLHAQQPGFRGSVTVDIGEGRSIVLNFWTINGAQRRRCPR